MLRIGAGAVAVGVAVVVAVAVARAGPPVDWNEVRRPERAPVDDRQHPRGRRPGPEPPAVADEEVTNG